MSSWQLCARVLHERDGHTGTAADCFNAGIDDVGGGLKRLKLFGFASSNGKRGNHAVWTLTALGVAWCEHRVIVMRGTCLAERRIVKPRMRRKNQPASLNAHPHRRHRIVATWLAAWPGPMQIATKQAEAA